jgi:hypothetical protein
MALVLPCVSGCDGCGTAPRPAIVADAAPPPPAIARSDAPVPAAYRDDPLWQRAMSEDDDIDRAALASREGASGLLDGFEQGGPVARAALRALPFASDAQVAYRRLGEVSLLTRDQARREVVTAINAIAMSETPSNEPLDPDGRGVCAQALLAVTKDESAERDVRALALSTLRLPSFRSCCAPAEMPSAIHSP